MDCGFARIEPSKSDAGWLMRRAVVLPNGQSAGFSTQSVVIRGTSRVPSRPHVSTRPGEFQGRGNLESLISRI